MVEFEAEVGLGTRRFVSKVSPQAVPELHRSLPEAAEAAGWPWSETESLP